MTRCFVSEQIAAHRNQEELLEVCFTCDEVITEDEESTEVLINGFGWNHVHSHCIKER